MKNETRIVRDFTREVKEPAGGYVITWKVSVNATQSSEELIDGASA